MAQPTNPLYQLGRFALMGIPQDVQDKIFELYFTTKKEGNGIGLAQTYQILQWHYGSVEFNSMEGQGTTFSFRLPLANSSLEPETEEPPAPTSELAAGM